MKESRRFIRLTANVPDDLVRQLDALVATHEPFATRHAIHLVALRLGLAELLVDLARMRKPVDATDT